LEKEAVRLNAREQHAAPPERGRICDKPRESATDMEKKTDRSNCHFAVQQAGYGKPVLVVQLYQDSIPLLDGTSMGFDLLGGTSGSKQGNSPRC